MRAPGLGSARLAELARRHGSIERLLKRSRDRLRAEGLTEETIDAIRHPDRRRLEHDLEWLSRSHHHLLSREAEDYPPLLEEIPDPPCALFVDGDPDVLWRPQVAVIGSRNPTAGGIDNARDFATELVRQGMTITSGLASGIDSVAHEAALDAGGTTLAVMGTGLDVIYPSSSADLAERVRKRGALVSEYPPGIGARRHHFPARNRIISGLSLGVLVIEAGLRSGTLITARLAANQGREVFALPGSIHNPMSKGCHRLIRDGARLVETVTDLMAELAPLAARLAGDLEQQIERSAESTASESLEKDPQETQEVGQDPDYRRLWSCLGFDPKPFDAIIEQSGLTARAVSAMLLMLELKGRVETHPGGAYSRKK